MIFFQDTYVLLQLLGISGFFTTVKFELLKFKTVCNIAFQHVYRNLSIFDIKAVDGDNTVSSLSW